MKLEEAVLQLASERDITTASVSELTRRAGVVRTTFYAHADTPVNLLTSVLSRELDDARDLLLFELAKGVEKGQFRDLTRRSLTKVVDHVLRYEAVYGGASSASSAYALRTVLGGHIADSVFRALEAGYFDAPSRKPEELTLYAAYMATGAAGAIEVWLRLSKPRSREMLLTAIDDVLPSWYV